MFVELNIIHRAQQDPQQMFLEFLEAVTSHVNLQVCSSVQVSVNETSNNGGAGSIGSSALVSLSSQQESPDPPPYDSLRFDQDDIAASSGAGDMEGEEFLEDTGSRLTVV